MDKMKGRCIHDSFSPPSAPSPAPAPAVLPAPAAALLRSSRATMAPTQSSGSQDVIEVWQLSRTRCHRPNTELRDPVDARQRARVVDVIAYPARVIRRPLE